MKQGNRIRGLVSHYSPATALFQGLRMLETRSPLIRYSFVRSFPSTPADLRDNRVECGVEVERNKGGRCWTAKMEIMNVSRAELATCWLLHSLARSLGQLEGRASESCLIYILAPSFFCLFRLRIMMMMMRDWP